MIKLWLPVTCLLFLNAARGQSTYSFMSARASGMGNTFACLSDEWSMFNNIGGLASVRKKTAAFSCDIQPALPGSAKVAATCALPLKTGVAGMGIFKFGDDLYNEQQLSAGYANKFGIASLGVKINYIQYHAEGLGTKGVLSVSAGGIAQLTKQLSVGAHITNINQPEIASLEHEHLPTIMNVGIGFTASEKIFVTTELEKDLDYHATWKAGLEYKAHKKVLVRTGFNSYPAAAFFGLGFKSKKFTFDYAFRQVPATGGGHQATLAHTFQ